MKQICCQFKKKKKNSENRQNGTKDDGYPYKVTLPYLTNSSR